MCLCAFFCTFATAYCHLVCRPLSSRIEGAKSSAITVFRPFYSWFAFCSSQPSLPAFIIGWVALSVIVPSFVVLPNVVTFILLLSLVSFPPRVSWLRSSHPRHLLSISSFFSVLLLYALPIWKQIHFMFFFQSRFDIQQSFGSRHAVLLRASGCRMPCQHGIEATWRCGGDPRPPSQRVPDNATAVRVDQDN